MGAAPIPDPAVVQMALIIVTGPPAAGKSTWVAENADPSDVLIDLDRIASALTVSGIATHDHPDHVLHIALEARQAAIVRAVRLARTCDVYVIHGQPKPADLKFYGRHRARIVTVDPGRDVVLARAEAERSPQALAAAERWYAARGRMGS